MDRCRMISIDSSTKKTAYAVFDNGEYKESALINLEQTKNMDERLYEMSLRLLDVLEEKKPDIIYIEDTVVVRNAQTQRFLTRLQGVVYAYCIKNNCEFNAIRPTQWRKLAGIEQGRKTREKLKEEAVALVEENIKKEVNDDEAEAVLIGFAAIKQFEEN